MNHRIPTNFSAGPAALPDQVIEQLQTQVFNYRNQGYSLMEISHRSTLYQEVHQSVIAKIRSLLAVPSSYEVLLLAGGATLQFAMVPLNLGTGGHYVVAGAWGQKAYQSALTVGPAHQAYTGAPTWNSLPSWHEVAQHSNNARYLHITSNETINGIQWHTWPPNISIPVVADMSSDILSRELPIAKFALIYASTQKNMGVAGATVVILNPEVLSPKALAPYLDYRTHVKAGSLYNTPCAISVYSIGLMIDWIEEQGGLLAMQRHNQHQASKLYAALDSMHEFYTRKVAPPFSSAMNVVFDLANPQLTAPFLQAALSNNLLGINGHRSVGGVRVSLYNSITERGVDVLIDFMQEFARTHG